MEAILVALRASTFKRSVFPAKTLSEIFAICSGRASVAFPLYSTKGGFVVFVVNKCGTLVNHGVGLEGLIVFCYSQIVDVEVNLLGNLSVEILGKVYFHTHTLSAGKAEFGILVRTAGIGNVGVGG